MFDPEEGSIELPRNVGNHLRVDTAQNYRRLESLARALRELSTSLRACMGVINAQHKCSAQMLSKNANHKCSAQMLSTNAAFRK